MRFGYQYNNLILRKSNFTGWKAQPEHVERLNTHEIGFYELCLFIQYNDDTDSVWEKEGFSCISCLLVCLGNNIVDYLRKLVVYALFYTFPIWQLLNNLVEREFTVRQNPPRHDYFINVFLDLVIWINVKRFLLDNYTSIKG